MFVTGNLIWTPILQGCRLTGKDEVMIVIKFWGIFTHSFDFFSYFSKDLFYFMEKSKSFDIAYLQYNTKVIAM